MTGDNALYYWDTCLFLAWVNDEERKSGEMDGIREVVSRHRRREIKIMTSTVTQIEVLQSKLPAGMSGMFLEFMKRLTRISVDAKIANLAHDLRDYYAIRAAEHGGKKLSTPDAIHLATAIFLRADEFHTFDHDGDAKHLGLLPLSGDVGGHTLTICKPVARSPQLDLRRGRR